MQFVFRIGTFMPYSAPLLFHGTPLPPNKKKQRQVLLVEQALLTLPGHLRTAPVYSSVW
jgi:hypothetical protein